MDDGIGAAPEARIGQPMRRIEDGRLLTGRGSYAEDTVPPGAAFAVFVRAAEAHGRIRALDIGAAAAMPGVLAVLTAAELQADGFRPIPCVSPASPRPGTEFHRPPRHALAMGHVRHVGEPVAVVVAKTQAEARDAAEAVALDIEPLPAVTDPAEAIAAGAPLVWAEVPGNVCLDWYQGDADAVARGLAAATHVVELALVNTRVAPVSLEPRAAWVAYDPAARRWRVTTGSQGVAAMHRTLSACLPEGTALRVISADVGGGFGMKTQPYPEHVALMAAARRIGRPVRWTADRSEAFLTDNHGRDSLFRARMGLDAAGRITALSVDALQAMGAYLTAAGPHVATQNPARCLSSVYRVPAMAFRVRCVMTNATPIGPYRGAGRPEANYLLEALMDRAAAATGLDRVEIRRRNLIRPDQIPYTTPFGQTYDSGDFPALLDLAVALGDWDGFAARRAASQAAGRLRGIGLATYLEASGTLPQETALIRFEPDGMVSVATGAQSNGQGHQTVFAQIAADHLGLPVARVRVETGDTDRLGAGHGSVASRSLMAAGGAIVLCARAVLDRARAEAARHLEAAEADLDYRAGVFTIAGTDRAVSIADLAEATRGPEGASALDTLLEAAEGHETFPNGAHLVEVEIEPATGAVSVLDYLAVDDFGVVVNPMIVEGQVQGGIAQGIGQVLGEQVVYRDGQPVSGSFMDYPMPRADQMPRPRLVFRPTPSTRNPLGAKGCGEAGTTGAIAATMNAINDALASAGAGPIGLPATPARIWAALQRV